MPKCWVSLQASWQYLLRVWLASVPGAAPPCRAGAAWLAPCESPQAHVSLSRFNLGLREPQRKLEGELGSDGEQVPGFVLLGHGRSIAVVCSAAWI